MQRKHVTGIALLLAIAVAAGLLAVVRTAGLTASGGSAATDALVQARTRQLDAVERSLRAQVARLDAAPAAGGPTAAATLTAGAAPAAAAPQKVVYVRPAPIVRTIHRAHGDDEGGTAGTSGGGDD